MNLEKLAQMVAEGFQGVGDSIESLDRKQHDRFTNIESRLSYIENKLSRFEDSLGKELGFSSDLRDNLEPRVVALEAASQS